MRERFTKMFRRIPIFLILLLLLQITGCTSQDVSGSEEGKSDISVKEEDIAGADISASSFGDNSQKNESDSDKLKNDELDNDELTVQFLDVGQGSSALIRQGDSSMLIDGGDRDYSSFVVSYLKKQGITSLDYVVVSHYDSDHLSGIVGVLNAMECKLVLAPDYEEDTKIYESFSQVIQEKKIPLVHPKPGDNYTFENSSFQIVGPVMGVYEDANSNSIGIHLEYGDSSFLICGDTTEESEMDILYQGVDLESDVFAANHHGSKYSNTWEFLEAVDPDFMVVSCGKGNSYGHPDASVLLSVQKLGASLYRTDLQGTVTAVSDGETILFENDVCMDYRSGTEIRETLDNGSDSMDIDSKSEEPNTDSKETDSKSEEPEITYILNTNSKKFHSPNCSSVDDINEENKVYSSDTKEDLIEKDYSPCKRCKP